MQSVKNDKPAAARQEYPCLKQCTSSGTVVLFNSQNGGVVVWSPGKEFSLGRAVGEKYIVYDDADCFVPFTGTITLQN